MTKSFAFALFILSSTLEIRIAKAQVDLTSQLLGTGTYVIKNSSKKSKESEKRDQTKARGPQSEGPAQVLQNNASATQNGQVPAATPAAESNTATEPSVIEQAKSLMSPEYEKIQNYYNEQLQAEDIRRNKVELSVATVFNYNDSKSNYSYRTYTSAFPGLKVGANIWSTPSVGAFGEIAFSLGANTRGDTSTQSNTTVKYDLFDAGIKFRKFFGLESKTEILDFAMIYHQNSASFSSAENYRVKIRSSGFGLSLGTRKSLDEKHAWSASAALFPRLQHVEGPNNYNISSGSHIESVRTQFQIQYETLFTRLSQIYWGLQLATEKNQFDGVALRTDVETGQTPNGVSVTNSTVGFTFGYRWGY